MLATELRQNKISVQDAKRAARGQWPAIIIAICQIPAEALSSSNRQAVIFDDVRLARYSDSLVEGINILAIRGVNTNANSDDLLILPELVYRERGFLRRPEAKVYYTIDGTDPRDTDGNPSPTATLIADDQQLTIDRDARVIARNFDDSLRDRKGAVVLTNWSAPVQIDFVAAPEVGEDFDGDQIVAASDIDLLAAELRSAVPATTFDLTGDKRVDSSDMDELVKNILNTCYGDMDLNGTVDQLDFQTLATNFASAAGNWSLSDFDGQVGFSDFVILSNNFGAMQLRLAGT